MKKKFQIRIFMSLDDINQPGLDGFNTYELEAKLKGEMTLAEAKKVMDHMLETVISNDKGTITKREDNKQA